MKINTAPVTRHTPPAEVPDPSFHGSSRMLKRCNSKNKSGYPGVLFYKRSNSWRATIGINSKTIHLGYFSSFNEALRHRKAAEITYGYI